MKTVSSLCVALSVCWLHLVVVHVQGSDVNSTGPDVLRYDAMIEFVNMFAAETDGPFRLSDGLTLEQAVNQLVTYKQTSNVNCEPSRFYRLNGKCNNLQNPHWGAAFEPFVRELPNKYSDGMLVPRLYANNSTELLPSAREVSTRCLQSLATEEATDLHANYNQNLVAFGQYFSHDLALTPIMEGVDCCKNLDENGFHIETFTGGACFPILVPPDDRQFDHCMVFNRSVYKVDSSGIAQQLSSATHFIDQSTVYGSTVNFSTSIRTLVNGTLRTDHHGLLPQDNTQKCVLRAPLTGCPVGGDSRVNVFPGLTITHLIFHLEHNRLAKALHKDHPDWYDERLFQEARSILIAETQNIIYKEYLPMILGEQVMKIFGLNENARYDPTLNPSIINSFQTAAFRFGHSEITNMFYLHGDNGSSELLQNMYFRPDKLLHNDQPITGDFILSLMTHRKQKVDRKFAKGVADMLFFEVDGPGRSSDLPGRSIQRGRDHGLPPYVDFMNHAKEQFKDHQELLQDQSPPSCVKGLYNSIQDMDLFVGGLGEKPVQGGAVGPTFAYLIGKQFKHLREGDRLFFDTRDSGANFSAVQVSIIKNTSYSGIICRTLGLDKVPLHPFRIPGEQNPYVDCDSIPDIIFTLW